MKKQIILSGLFLSTTVSFGQWTNPTTPSPIHSPFGQFVGIGTPSPIMALDVRTSSVNGGINVTQSGSGFSSLRLTNSTTGGRTWAVVSTGNGNSEGSGHFGFYDYSGGGYRMFINGSTGNVGIGTITPHSSIRLHVNGNHLVTNTAGNPTSAALIRGNSGLSTATNPEYTWWNNDQTGLFHPAINVIGFTIGGTEQMRITTNAVVIGNPAQATIPPGNLYKLYVQTGILTEKVKIALTSSLDWSDYVFASDYKLNTLEYVEKFVKENKHLPGVPSAEEVVKEGIDLGKMDAKLLEKIEELTLYIIELNKQNNELTERLNKLEATK